MCNKLVEVTGALDALRIIKTAGFSLFAEPKMYADSGEWLEFVGYAPLTTDVLTQRLTDYGIDASVVMTDAAIRITIKPAAPVGELVGVLRLGSVDYV